ncbi:DNA damage-binding protein CMR1 isoform X2 [Cucumis sativus]|uniref:DNA damage-binding protein CMR1 isoform X2 n=1 Tax=Cucumis sativus TaxID=3659 RepID=UPI0012F515BA|nr:DNA damage-binding protein CMR1 isoform X2 [Cucumis sativus]
MASQALTDYERQRLENIRRNDEMLAALKLQSKASELSAASKRQRVETKSEKVYPKTKPKKETPMVLRRSLRARGIPPDAKKLVDIDDLTESATKIRKSETKSMSSPRVLGPLEMVEVCSERESHPSLIESILGVLSKSLLSRSGKEELVDDVKEFKMGGRNGNFSNEVEIEGGGDGNCLKMDPIDNYSNLIKRVTEGLISDVKDPLLSSIKMEHKNDGSCLKPASLVLNADNIARVVPGRIMAVRFFPCLDSKMIVVGNKFGEVGFWNADHEGEEGNGVYLYHPHSGPISGISIQRHALSKVYTSCYDGFIRLMDVEKEMFDLVYRNEDTIFSLSQQSNDANCLYFSEGRGGLNIWDKRTGNCTMEWTLHEDRINSIDFNVGNSNIMATSSSDGTACIWDLRSVSDEKPQTLKTITHKKAIHSAYFSPSGRFLATTRMMNFSQFHLPSVSPKAPKLGRCSSSFDDTVGIYGGVNFKDTSLIPHDNQTGRWISSFRAIWGWDDSYIFIGNMKRAVDVISRAYRKRVFVLQSPKISAIPCRFDAHPYDVGTLAGATSGGQVYMWTMSPDI